MPLLFIDMLLESLDVLLLPLAPMPMSMPAMLPMSILVEKCAVTPCGVLVSSFDTLCG